MFPRLMLTQLLCPEVRPCCRHILLAWPSGICVGGLPLYSNSVTPPPGTPCPLQTAHSLPPALSSYLRSSSLADVPVVFFPDLSPLVCCRPRSPPQDRPGLLWGLWPFLLPPGGLHCQDGARPLDRDLPPPVVPSFLCFISRSHLGSLSTPGALVPPGLCTCCSFILERSPPSSRL